MYTGPPARGFTGLSVFDSGAIKCSKGLRLKPDARCCGFMLNL